MPPAPLDQPLNLFMQTVMTLGCWGGAFIFLVLALRRCQREGTAFYLVVIGAAALCSLLEPLYDIAFHLIWYAPGQWTLFTAFGLPQPIWVMGAYILVFAGPVITMVDKVEDMDRGGFWRLVVTVFATTAIFEMIAISGGTYGYYGPHALRMFGSPLIIAALEATFISSLVVLAAHFRQNVTRPGEHLLMIPLFGAAFFMGNFGAGWPLVIAINSSEDPSMAVVWTGTAASLMFAAAIIHRISKFLPGNAQDDRSATRRNMINQKKRVINGGSGAS